jgi:hypothetical protein
VTHQPHEESPVSAQNKTIFPGQPIQDNVSNETYPPTGTAIPPPETSTEDWSDDTELMSMLEEDDD